MLGHFRSILRCSCAAALVVGLAFGSQVLPAIAQTGAAGNVVLEGKVLSADTGETLANARVYAVHLDTKQVFLSAPSSSSGDYQITGLPFGYYDLAVETPEGLYLANRVINAPAGERIDVSVVLGPPQPEDTEWWSAEPDRRIPGLERVPDGVARIVEGRPPRKSEIVAGDVSPAATFPPAGAPARTAPAPAFAGVGGWLIPAAVAVGIVGLGVIATDDNDDAEDSAASPFF
jgi:hypothetical protein